MHDGGRGLRRIRRVIAWSCAVVAAASMATVAEAQSPSDGRDTEQQLADRFVPVMMLKEQPEPCSKDGEPYGPTSVDVLLGNDEIALRMLTTDNPVAQWGPDASDLFGLGEGFFLDFPGSSLRPGCIYERGFRKYAADIDPTVYAHIVQDPNEPDAVYLQYWFYWYYNDWNNKHESDWEGITLKFEASTIAEALVTEPIAVGYSQHEGGERADWNDEKLQRDGDRPVVYSSAGSHASYYTDALFLGRSASEGFGCDDTTGPSVRVDPTVIVLPDSVDSADAEFAWLEYDGRWGERQGGAFNGPTGPAAKDRWLEPSPWFEELRASSVVIPVGESDAISIIDVFCRAVETGSGALITWTVSPARVVLGFLILLGAVSLVVRRTSWDRVEPVPIVARRRAGQILRLVPAAYAARPVAFAMFGAVYLPAAVLAGLGGVLLEWIPFVRSLLDLAGSSSGTNLVLALFVGSAANVAAFVVVNGVTAHYLHQGANGTDGAIESIKLAWSRRRAFIGGFLRSFAIVFVLLVTVIGIPWGIRQLVRYQFLGQALMVDDRDGGAALRRSSELVAGRWWHTAIVTAALNGTVAAIATLAGVLLLVLAAGIPLWLFSALLALVSALFVPMASIAMTYLHADAIAQHRQAPRAELVEV